jgi:MFS family permease
VVGRFGLYRTSWCSYLAVAACLLAIGLVDSYWYWVPLRFATGFLLSCIFITTDTWVNQLADDRTRGRVIGIYSMALSGGMALGPAILALLGSSGYLPFAVDGLLPLLAVLPIVFARRRLPSTTHQRPASVSSFFLRAPTLLVCVAAAAFADQAAMSLLPVYMLREGLSERVASLSLVVMTVGSMALMYPIGWLADRSSRGRLVLACTIGSAALSVLLAVTVDVAALFFLVVFIWGGIYYAIYSLTLVQLGDRYSGPDLVAGNAACGAMWGIGGAAGTPSTGATMGALGPVGFPVAMTAVFAVLLVVLLPTVNVFGRKSVSERKEPQA